MMRVAVTETVNAYPGMPNALQELPALGDKLEDIRRANVAHHVELMREAHRQGVSAIGFGELFTGPYFALETREMWRGMAEDALEGPTVQELRHHARSLEMVVVAPLYEHESHTGKFFNTAVVIDADGTVAGRYRKTHIPQGSNEQGTFSERFYYERSTGCPQISGEPHFPVFATQVGKVGVAICYDRHFEGVVAALARGGAQLIFSPAVTFGAKSEAMWKMEFLVDACRHRVFIAGSNRRGSEAPWGQHYFGDSHVAGPNGLRCPNLSTHPNLIIADIDLGVLSQPDPSGWDLPRDTRPEIYREK